MNDVCEACGAELEFCDCPNCDEQHCPNCDFEDEEEDDES
jgi:hypothetical protein